MENPGFVSVLPTLLVFVLAIVTHRPIESLVTGALAGLAIVHGNQFITGFADTSIRVPTDEDVAWVILVVGATLSASTFGSHACFYSDATVLSAQASGCTAMQHALTQFPYALIAAALALAGYLLLAFVGFTT